MKPKCQQAKVNKKIMNESIQETEVNGATVSRESGASHFLLSLTIIEVVLQVVHDLCWITDDVVIVD